MTPISYAIPSIAPLYLLPILGIATKEKNQILLELFIASAALRSGIIGRISLFLMDQPDICECNTEFKIIYLSKEPLKNYGSGVKDTVLDQALDLLPNDPEKFNQTLYKLDKPFVDTLKFIFTMNPSDAEIEASILHEIGHIACRHTVYLHTPMLERHHYEFTADLFACANPRGFIGLSRNFKRRALQLFLLTGENIYKLLLTMRANKLQLSHPSDEKRLENLVLFENLLGQREPLYSMSFKKQRY